MNTKTELAARNLSVYLDGELLAEDFSHADTFTLRVVGESENYLFVEVLKDDEKIKN